MASEAKKDWVAEWNERIAAEYQAAVERGEHDEQCEYDVKGFYLCHCSKRRREAAGFTEPPAEELYFPPPDCTHCGEMLAHDGDSWYCSKCSLTWDSNGYGGARFTDDFGDDLAADAEKWRAKNQPVEGGSDR